MSKIRSAKIGDKVMYLGYRWKVIDILPADCRVLYRPFWKLKRTGVVIAW